jgi:hypothetical protein
MPKSRLPYWCDDRHAGTSLGSASFAGWRIPKTTKLTHYKHLHFSTEAHNVFLFYLLCLKALRISTSGNTMPFRQTVKTKWGVNIVKTNWFLLIVYLSEGWCTFLLSAGSMFGWHIEPAHTENRPSIAACNQHQLISLYSITWLPLIPK